MVRRRWYLVATVAVIILYVALHRAPTLPSLGGWDVFGVPGQFVNSTNQQTVRTAAPFVKRIPQSMNGLPYAGAVLHPQGLSGISFVELLYGKPTGPFVDVAESLSDLGVSAKATETTVFGVSFKIGRANFRAIRRSFAFGKVSGAHLIVVTSFSSPAWGQILTPLLR